MENVTVTVKRTVQVGTELTLPTYFTLNKYCHYKLLDKNTCLIVLYYPTDMETIKSLEVFSSIKMEHTRYLEIHVKEDNLDPLTEQQFNKHLNDCKKLLCSV